MMHINFLWTTGKCVNRSIMATKTITKTKFYNVKDLRLKESGKVFDPKGEGKTKT